MRIILPAALAVLVLCIPAAGGDDEAPPAPRTVEIDAGGGAKLVAEVHEPKGGGETKPAVIALPAEGSDHTSWKPVAERLASVGTTFVALDLKPAEGAAGYAGATEQALAVLRWVRGTLLADGKKIVLAGAGAGGNVAVAAARKDTGVVAVLVLGPLPGAGGVDAGVASWDTRPIALVAGAKSPQLGELKKMASPLAKQPRAETILVDGAAGHGADLLSGSPDAVLEVAQWIYGWIDRPRFDDLDRANNVRESQGPGHIVASQSSSGIGMGGGGGLELSGQRAPQGIDAIGLLIEPDPSSKRLTDRTRRLTITPGKAKPRTIVVKIERSAGKGWKAEGTVELADCGGFGKDANVATYAIWLPPRILGAKPFSEIAAKSCFVDKGKFDLEDEKPFGGTDFGGRSSGEEERALFKTSDPSTWDRWTLR